MPCLSWSYRRRSLLALAAAVTAEIASMAAPAIAGATPSRPDPGPSWPARANWQRYVEGPIPTRPVSVVATAGDVTNAQALVTGQGTATLTLTAGGTTPSILLDYGEDTTGTPYFDVSAETGTPTMQAAYSEASIYANADGDSVSPGIGVTTGDHYETFSITGPGTVVSSSIPRAERFEWIQLDQPGSVTLSAAGIDLTSGYSAGASQYQGWFLSSSPELNKIYYAGAYTTQLDMLPAGTEDNSVPVIVDGAKRDRQVWLGDMSIEGPTVYDTLGTNGEPYLEGSLLAALPFQASNGEMPGVLRLPGLTTGGYYSLSYSIFAADDLVDYYRYTGDQSFAQQAFPAVKAQLGYDASFLDSNGLISTNSSNGHDWDAYDQPKTGEVTAYNALYVHALTEAAYMARHLGDPSDAATWTAQAQAVKNAINTYLWNPVTGVYNESNQVTGTYAQDGNSYAILYGIASPAQTTSILAAMKAKLWIPTGAEPFYPHSTSTSFSNPNPAVNSWLISPFISAYEAAATFAGGDSNDALTLIENEWGPMVDKSNPLYTGATWENIAPPDNDPFVFASLAHGWSSGPTSEMAGYVLGAQPIDPGYRTWVVAPHLGTLRWAQGQVPTAFGPLDISVAQAAGGFRIRVSAPAGTRGVIALPVPRDSRVIVNGTATWDAGRAQFRSGLSAHAAAASAIDLTIPAGGTYVISATF
jgi:hypothetical protein